MKISKYFPFEDKNELKKYVEPIRKEHFKAVHFCYAYRLRTFVIGKHKRYLPKI